VYDPFMTKVIQVRGVTERTHAGLVRRAAEAGMSLSDYVRRELDLVVARDANEEALRRLALLPPSGLSGAELVRAERDSREEELARRATRS
jgi:hypothetical protein